jgi:hypothetical protein
MAQLTAQVVGGGSRLRRPGDRAPHPRRSVRRTPVRRAYKPSADDRSHRRVGSTRYEIPRETVHLATGGPTTDPSLAKGGFNQRGWRESLVRASTRQRGTRARSARGASAGLPRKGWDRLTIPTAASSRSGGSFPSGDRAVKGREARGAALKGARARRSVGGAVKATWAGLAAGACGLS